VEFKKTDTEKLGPEKESFPVDQAQADRVKEILHLLANAITAAKIFPSDHQTVAGFLSDLHARLKAFLDENWKLELVIEERAFFFGDKKVYEDPHPVKSLPFFFFKDGMQMLNFYKGIEKEEIQGFLEAIKKVAQLPPEEGDIVNALWEKDFANIRCVAPDDYLETKIGVGKRPLGIQVDKSELYSGQVKLSPEDLEEIRTKALALGGVKNVETEDIALAELDKLPTPSSSSEQKEMQEIESLLLSNRRLSAEEEYLNLMVEMIYLEDRMDQFPSLAEAVKQYHQETIQKNDFPKALFLLRSLHDIKDVFAKNNKSKADRVEDMIREMSQETALAQLQESLDSGPVADPDALLSYLKLIGPKAARAVADLFEKSNDPGFRGKALDLLKEVGRIDVEALLRLTQESKPVLAKEIIASLGQSKDKRIIPYLANFISYKNKAIKLEAIRTLGKLENEAAAKILLGFLSDADEDVRTAAAENLKFCEDRQTLEQIFALVSDKSFNKRSALEKKAFFDLLGRTRTAESCAYLRKTLRRPSVFLDSQKKAACLNAVRALEMMATASAREALTECARRRRGKIRKACLEALAKMAEPAGPSSPQETPK
jgi:hypothetical protein